MLTAPTIDKLTRLSLGGMARALVEQHEQPNYHAFSFDDRLGLLIDRELQDRENRRLERYSNLPNSEPTPAWRISTSAILVAWIAPAPPSG